MPSITAACQDSEIARWTRIPSPYTLAHATEWVEAEPQQDAVSLLVLDAATEQLLGSVGLVAIEREQARAAVGFWTAAWARRRGVAAGAIRLLAPWAFEALALARLQAFAHEENRGSQRTLERVGFTREGILRSFGEVKGERWDMAVFSLLAEELAQGKSSGSRRSPRFGSAARAALVASAQPATMDAPVVVAVLECLDRHRIETWVDGGWGVDALAGEQTRAHGDLDLVLAEADREPAQAALASLGYRPSTAGEPGLPARAVLRARGARQVDLHPVVFDAAGDAWQDLGGGAWGGYPAEGLAGVGEIAGRRVRCLTPQLQLRHRLGYPLGDSDRHDLALLAERFGVGLPPAF